MMLYVCVVSQVGGEVCPVLQWKYLRVLHSSSVAEHHTASEVAGFSEYRAGAPTSVEIACESGLEGGGIPMRFRLRWYHLLSEVAPAGLEVEGCGGSCESLSRVRGQRYWASGYS